MSNPHYIQVPRQGNPSPNIVHQSTTYSEQTNAWLREDHKDMPWHIIDSMVTSSSNTSEPNLDTNVSHNPATQGSARQASSQPHMRHHLVHQRPTRSPQRSSGHGHDLT
ncbi:hypothetical protein FACUT_1896 [Fusarium acutatum]|uniref:Uncharacterized protein n=1 Tax=Fusarium acutatum TaxID=78861 RepID=A0A8H4K4X0_9HYPO|nr:hypothetical protein FACUT_1896 [Fusarium acutatum]